MTELLQASIEAIETGYEFLLAYAAQGRDSDGGGPSEVRNTLTGMRSASAEVVDLLEKSANKFAWVVSEDARKADAAIELVLGQAAISSEIVDNLNASIHLRALLTDLFLVSEAADSKDPA